MKAIFNSNINAKNWTFGKEYIASPSFVTGFVSLIDDDGAEQIVKVGSTNFTWIY